MKRVRRTALRAALVLCGLIAAVFAQNYPAIDSLPDAKGKETVDKVCSVCHPSTDVSRFRKSKDEWQAVIDDMLTKGADASDADLDTIVNYLTKCFGPMVNINTASADDIGKQLGLSAKDAQAIVDYRQNKGNFKELADLKSVPGLDYASIEPLRYRIAFNA